MYRCRRTSAEHAQAQNISILPNCPCCAPPSPSLAGENLGAGGCGIPGKLLFDFRFRRPDYQVSTGRDEAHRMGHHLDPEVDPQ